MQKYTFTDKNRLFIIIICTTVSCTWRGPLSLSLVPSHHQSSPALYKLSQRPVHSSEIF